MPRGPTSPSFRQWRQGPVNHILYHSTESRRGREYEEPILKKGMGHHPQTFWGLGTPLVRQLLRWWGHLFGRACVRKQMNLKGP
jgi:hypothetical protein